VRPTKKQLYSAFNKYNSLLFYGALPPVPIHYRRMGSYALYQEPCWKYPLGIICIGDIAPGGWKGVLLHEMVHVYLDLADLDEYEHGQCAWHGPAFTRQCNRIAGILGLPSVDMDEAHAWPHIHHYVTFETDLDE
jgi:hypothetical protein